LGQETPGRGQGGMASWGTGSACRLRRHQPEPPRRAGGGLLQSTRESGAVHQGGQERHQVDTAVMSEVPRQRGPAPASRPGLQSGQLHADTGLATDIDNPGSDRRLLGYGSFWRYLKHMRCASATRVHHGDSGRGVGCHSDCGRWRQGWRYEIAWWIKRASCEIKATIRSCPPPTVPDCLGGHKFYLATLTGSQCPKVRFLADFFRFDSGCGPTRSVAR
jgi:hypothetical protein